MFIKMIFLFINKSKTYNGAETLSKGFFARILCCDDDELCQKKSHICIVLDIISEINKYKGDVYCFAFAPVKRKREIH